MHYFTALVISEPENIGFIGALTTSRLLGFLPVSKGFLVGCVRRSFSRKL